jgi:hypothetical protein
VFEDLEAPTIGGQFGMSCWTWVNVDSTYWGGVASDEFLVTVGSDGKGKGITPRILREDLVRRRGGGLLRSE